MNPGSKSGRKPFFLSTITILGMWPGSYLGKNPSFPRNENGPLEEGVTRVISGNQWLRSTIPHEQTVAKAPSKQGQE